MSLQGDIATNAAGTLGVGSAYGLVFCMWLLEYHSMFTALNVVLRFGATVVQSSWKWVTQVWTQPASAQAPPLPSQWNATYIEGRESNVASDLIDLVVPIKDSSSPFHPILLGEGVRVSVWLLQRWTDTVSHCYGSGLETAIEPSKRGRLGESFIRSIKYNLAPATISSWLRFVTNTECRNAWIGHPARPSPAVRKVVTPECEFVSIRSKCWVHDSVTGIAFTPADIDSLFAMQYAFDGLVVRL